MRLPAIIACLLLCCLACRAEARQVLVVHLTPTRAETTRFTSGPGSTEYGTLVSPALRQLLRQERMSCGNISKSYSNIATCCVLGLGGLVLIPTIVQPKDHLPPLTLPPIEPLRGTSEQMRQPLRDGRFTFSFSGLAPSTEIFLTCPEQYALHITAPEQGRWVEMRDLAGATGPATASWQPLDYHAPAVWHRLYTGGTPKGTLEVRVTKRAVAGQFALLERLAGSRPAAAMAVLLHLLAALVGALVVVGLRWRGAGRPGRLWGHLGRVLLLVEGSGLVLALGFVALFLGAGRLALAGQPLLASLTPYAFLLVPAGLVTLDLRRPADWRKGLTLATWAVTAVLYALLGFLAFTVLGALEAV